MPFSRPDPFLLGRHLALVVLRFLLNATEETDLTWPNPITLYYLTNHIRSAETGERIGLGSSLPHLVRNIYNLEILSGHNIYRYRDRYRYRNIMAFGRNPQLAVIQSLISVQ